MKTNRIVIISIVIIALAIAFYALMGPTDNNPNTVESDLEEHDFDSYFSMNIPRNVTFERINGTGSGNITLYINYKDPTESINVIYAESVGGKDMLVSAYEDMAKDQANITIKTINNGTIVHFNDDNSIGEINYHDLAVVGDDTRYVLMQGNDESLMNSMAESVKLK